MVFDHCTGCIVINLIWLINNSINLKWKWKRSGQQTKKRKSRAKKTSEKRNRSVQYHRKVIVWAVKISMWWLFEIVWLWNAAFSSAIFSWLRMLSSSLSLLVFSLFSFKNRSTISTETEIIFDCVKRKMSVNFNDPVQLEQVLEALGANNTEIIREAERTLRPFTKQVYCIPCLLQQVEHSTNISVRHMAALILKKK